MYDTDIDHGHFDDDCAANAAERRARAERVYALAWDARRALLPLVAAMAADAPFSAQCGRTKEDQVNHVVDVMIEALEDCYDDEMVGDLREYVW